MPSYSHAFYELKNKLQPLYDDREAAAITHEVLQHITGLDKTKRLLEKDVLLTETQQIRYDHMAVELLSGKPLQYVTGIAWFMGREFYVNEHVLIPRPETEELVQWIVEKLKIKNKKLKILDIGTGSGCIPISLKLALPAAEITGIDISAEALIAAKENAKRLGANMAFLQMDFLELAGHNKLGTYDVIVSNPPYIPESERTHMHPNVIDHEPAIALFVPDEDPLIFYRAIAAFGKQHLNSKGCIYCELEAGQALACRALFEREGYNDVEVRKDMHGNWRMLKCGV